MPIEKLALMLASKPDVDASHLIRQVEGWQRMHSKVPTWAKVDGLEYPPRLSLEQCSGEEAARYKAAVVTRLLADLSAMPQSMVDLTGGMGVDFSFIAPLFAEATYVERQDELCRLARHNFPLLSLSNAQVVCADGVEYLRQMSQTDLIYLDPARRNEAGRKVVLISDCQPDVCALLDLLTNKSRYTIIKLSPMLDIVQAVRALGDAVHEVHVVATNGECKELLLVLSSQRKGLAQIVAYDGGTTLSFSLQEEEEATPIYINECGKYLYEPGSAVMKAGAFKIVATRMGLGKLHPNTHLYSSDAWVKDFPGRKFRIIRELSFSKADVRSLRELTKGKANLTVRNFPATVSTLRKKLRIADGGTHYIFATTFSNGRHSLILTEKCY